MARKRGVAGGRGSSSLALDKSRLMSLARENRLSEARDLGLRICKACKHDPEAWFLLGAIFGNLGEYRKAVECCRKTVKLQPDAPVAYYNLGVALARLECRDEAASCLRKAIRLNPRYADAWHELGNVLQATGKYEGAIEAYRKTLTTNPNLAVAHVNLATALASGAAYREAVAEMEMALRLDPSLVDVHYRLSDLLAQCGELDRAIEHLQTYVSAHSDNMEAHTNMGCLLLRVQRVEEAIGCFQQALNINPASAVVHFNLGNAYKEKGDLRGAERSYRRSLDLDPAMAVAHNNLGLVLGKQDRLDEALAHFQKSIEIEPVQADPYINISGFLRDEGRIEEAVRPLDEFIRISPEIPAPHWDRALLWLQLGDFERGWPEYEWRLKHGELRAREFPQRRWHGEDLSDQTLLVFAEQGIGDEVMFASCFDDIISQAAHVVIDCAPRLQPLFQRSFPTATVHGGFQDDDLSWLNTMPEINFQIPAGSLTLHTRKSLSAFKGVKTPYLMPHQAAVEKWERRYRQFGQGLKVGISWRGGHVSKMKLRSTTLGQWHKVLTLDGVCFINLQYGECRDELEGVRRQQGIDIHHWDDSDPLKELDDFAAQISALDLVISVDNSTVHLAGSLGVRTWVLQPFCADWRWLLGRNDSVWYPGIKQFRQPNMDDWTAVFEVILTELVELLVVAS